MEKRLSVFLILCLLLAATAFASGEASGGAYGGSSDGAGPRSAAGISALATCGLTQKEGYGPIFRTTVLYIVFGMLAVILMCILFPGLCAA